MRGFVIPLLAVLLTEVGVARAAPAEVERGRYLVEQVGMCVECHSPRGPDGSLVESMAFHGAPIGFAPTHPMPVWAEYAPRLAGLPAGYDAATLVHFLQTGSRPDGSAARPPMPSYRLDRADAEAVVAYLQSLAR